jgi:hypothetical protein
VFIPDEVKEERAAYRRVQELAIRFAFTASDYENIMRKTEEMIGDRSYRKHVLSCVEKYDNPRKRVCCFLDALELPKLRRRYCRWHSIPLILADIENILLGLMILASIFATPFLPIIIGCLLHSYGKMYIDVIELLIAEILWLPITIKIYMKIGDRLGD